MPSSHIHVSFPSGPPARFLFHKNPPANAMPCTFADLPLSLSYVVFPSRPSSKLFNRNPACCAVELTEANGLLTSASRKLMLHFIPSRTISISHLLQLEWDFRSPPPVSPPSSTSVFSTPFFRVGQTLLAAPDSTVFSSSSSSLRSSLVRRTDFVDSCFSSHPFPPDIVVV